MLDTLVVDVNRVYTNCEVNEQQDVLQDQPLLRSFGYLYLLLLVIIPHFFINLTKHSYHLTTNYRVFALDTGINRAYSHHILQIRPAVHT